MHHVGKDNARGPRGSTAFLGAVDVAINVSKAADTLTVKVRKMKDDEAGEPFYVRVVKVVLDDEERTNSLVLEPRAEPATVGRKKLTDVQENILDVCRQAGQDGITNREWQRRVLDEEIT